METVFLHLTPTDVAGYPTVRHVISLYQKLSASHQEYVCFHENICFVIHFTPCGNNLLILLMFPFHIITY
jgi:hypothetical protein